MAPPLVAVLAGLAALYQTFPLAALPLPLLLLWAWRSQALRTPSPWLLLLLLASPPVLLKRSKPRPPEAAALAPALIRAIQPENAWLQAALQELDQPGALQAIALPPGLALTVQDLNRRKLAWIGGPFAEWEAGKDSPQWLLADGKVWLRQIIALPDAQRARAFLLIDFLFGHTQPEAAEPDFLSRLTGNSLLLQETAPHSLGLLSSISQLQGWAPPYSDVLIVAQIDRQPWEAALALLWCLALFTTILLPWSKRTSPHSLSEGLSLLAALVLLVFLPPQGMGNLALFDARQYGTATLGQLFRSPFHLITFLAIVASLSHALPLSRSWQGPRAALLLGAAIALPAWIQRDASFSLLNPREWLAHSGAFSLMLATILLQAHSLIRWNQTLRRAGRPRLLSFLCACLPMAASPLLGPLPLRLLCLPGLILLMALPSSPLAPRLLHLLQAAIAALLLTLPLHHKEQQSALFTLRQPLVDEITLLQDRNHFRFARLLAALAELEANRGLDHPQATTLLATRCRLLEEDLAFGLLLSDVNGHPISLLENHLDLSEIPFPLLPPDRIEFYRRQQGDPQWSVLRHVTPGGWTLGMVLANDFANLSLVREQRNLEGRYDGRTVLEVLAADGSVLYRDPALEPLPPEDWAALEQGNGLFVQRDRQISFLFRHGETRYRLSWLALPLGRLLSRSFCLFWALWVALSLLSAYRHVVLIGRKGWLGRLNRSFNQQLYALVLGASLLPATLAATGALHWMQTRLRAESEALMQEKLAITRRAALTMIGAGSATPAETMTPGTVHQLAQLTGEQVSTFVSGCLDQTTQPELFRRANLPRRLPPSWLADLHRQKNGSLVTWQPAAGSSVELLLGMLDLEGEARTTVMLTTIPDTRRMRLRWEAYLEVAAATLLAFILLAATMTRAVTRNVLRPVRAITLAASRLGRGKDAPIALHRQDEFDQMVRAFNAMQERIHTARTQLTQQLDLFSTTLQAMSSGLILCDSQGRVLVQNTQATLFLKGAQPADLRQLVALQPGLAPLLDACDRRRDGQWKLSLGAGEDHRELLVGLRTRDLHPDHPVQFMLVLNDITHLLQADRFQAWSEMARRVAHDIKNPLTPILLELDHLQTVARDRPQTLNQVLQESTTEIRTQVEQLRHIAVEFADYARPLALAMQPTELGQLLAELAATYRHHPDLQLLLDLPEEPQVCAIDPRYLKRALQNLLENAIQAQSRQPWVRLALVAADSSCKILVEDHGPGVPDELRERIFEAYFSTRNQGSGLGLAIAHRIVELHGGRLYLAQDDAAPNTLFVIELPRGAANP
jgi:signal transduction histidine kinase